MLADRYETVNIMSALGDGILIVLHLLCMYALVICYISRFYAPNTNKNKIEYINM